MVNLPVATSLLKTDSFISRSHRGPRVPKLVLAFPLQARMLAGLILCRISVAKYILNLHLLGQLKDLGFTFLPPVLTAVPFREERENFKVLSSFSYFIINACFLCPLLCCSLKIKSGVNEKQICVSLS